jgi:hypothetical protein
MALCVVVGGRSVSQIGSCPPRPPDRPDASFKFCDTYVTSPPFEGIDIIR